MPTLNRARCALSLASWFLAGASLAQNAPPALWQALATVPPAAHAWQAAERARSPMIVRSLFVSVQSPALAAVPATGAPPLATLALDLFGRRELFEVQRVEVTLGHRVFTGGLRGSLRQSMPTSRFPLLALSLVATIGGHALAQDDCSGAILVVGGPNGPYSNVGSTTSAPAWPCGAGANDVWFLYVPPRCRPVDGRHVRRQL